MEASSVGLRERLGRFNEGMAQVDVLVKQHLEASKQFAEGQERYKMTRTAFDSPFPAIHLVEEAAPPIIKSRPKRTLIVLAVTVLAFLFSVAGALIFDTYKDIDWKSITNAR
jgi:tyrosine-protein kinase Etk/Wzc